MIRRLAEKVVEKAARGIPATYYLVKAAQMLGIQVDLEKLDDVREGIQALLTDADADDSADMSVMLWLRSLRTIAFEAEDLGDEITTLGNISKNQLEQEEDRRSRKRKWGLTSCISLADHFSFARRIEEMKRRYDQINLEMADLRIKRRKLCSKRQIPLTNVTSASASASEEQGVQGRQELREEIAKFFLEVGGGTNVSVISIIGSGGIGKTTTARLIFQDERLKSFFPVRLWVGLHQRSDAVGITKEIIELLTSKQCSLPSFDLMQCHLKRMVSGKRFLLVLDDMWNEDVEFWETLRAPLLSGAEGSKVLVTTQSSLVSKNMEVMHRFHLRGLGDEQCWSLFRGRAFARAEGSSTILKEHPDVEKIGREIANKCKGSPLAAKFIASLFFHTTEENAWYSLWRDISEREAIANDMLPILKVSYDRLPLSLKHCIAFCSVYPNGHEFDKEELVRLWMALGFTQPDGRKLGEEIGSEYFNRLLGMMFFLTSDNCQRGIEKYKMPSVIHALAQSLSGFECLGVDYGEITTAHYGLLYQHKEETVAFGKIYDSKCLRALILHGESGVLTRQMLCEIFERLRYLRVLDLRNSQVEELPDSIDALILLRYLNLYGTRVKRLPESVGSLFNLQTLELGKCHNLVALPDSIGYLKQLRYLGLSNTEIESLPESVSRLCNLHTLELGECYRLLKLPENMSSLVNLRHLGLHLSWQLWDRGIGLISMPPGLGRLTTLQTLSRFTVGLDIGGGIGQLKNMNLQGELCISKLENVVSLFDVKEANLREKQYIDSMMLRWNNDVCTGSEEVIEFLRPHENLRCLWIDNYNGIKLPNWMADRSFSRLETLILSECKRCIFQLFVGILPRLKYLYLKGLSMVLSMEHACVYSSDHMQFPSLTKLSVIDMPNLERWFKIKKNEMAHLTEVLIANCPKLKELPCLPPKLKELKLKDCENLVVLPMLPSIQTLVVEGGNETLIKWIYHLTSLSSLTISRISDLTFISQSSLQHLTSLKELTIKECNMLVSVAQNESLKALSSLEYLKILSCLKLASLADEGLPATLKEFQLHYCSSLTSLPQGLSLLTSLNRMEIHIVPMLTVMPALPPGLQYLAICGCPTLQERCQTHGADWDRICYIPFLEIEPCSQADTNCSGEEGTTIQQIPALDIELISGGDEDDSGLDWAKISQSPTLDIESVYQSNQHYCTKVQNFSLMDTKSVYGIVQDDFVIDGTTAHQIPILETAQVAQTIAGSSGGTQHESKIRKYIRSSRRISTATPEDGYTWRKYGQKDILGCKFPRGYYRCNFKITEGCKATKQVQRKDDDPSLYDVTYYGQHTCLAFATPDSLITPKLGSANKKQEVNDQSGLTSTLTSTSLNTEVNDQSGLTSTLTSTSLNADSISHSYCWDVLFNE